MQQAEEGFIKDKQEMKQTIKDLQDQCKQSTVLQNKLDKEKEANVRFY